MSEPVPIERPIHGVAVDAGSGLAATIREARGANARDDDLKTFKRCVLTTLGPLASTVLIDAEFGPDLLADYPDGCAAMMAYEADVYHITDADRMTVLPTHIEIGDYPGMGVNLLKFFMFYAPDDPPELNARKEQRVADIGAACAAHGLRFLMEPLVYDRHLQPGSIEFALRKPELVRRATATFADPRFGASVLKVEVPVDLTFVEGYGDAVMSRAEAVEAFRAAAAAAGDIPLVYLSAGVPFDRFRDSLHLAREAGIDFAGFMCGRAIWSDGIAVFGRDGEAGLREWLATVGAARLRELIAAISDRTPDARSA